MIEIFEKQNIWNNIQHCMKKNSKNKRAIDGYINE